MSEHEAGEGAPQTGGDSGPPPEAAPPAATPDLDDVDGDSLQSFPASDPPASSGTT